MCVLEPGGGGAGTGYQGEEAVPEAEEEGDHRLGHGLHSRQGVSQFLCSVLSVVDCASAHAGLS